MSKMFDALRRAEAERRKRSGNGDPAPEETASVTDERSEDVEVDSPTFEVPEPTAPRPSVNGSGPLPEDFMRELGILRNSIDTILGKRGKRSLLFTSPTHEEGTTLLATSYAQLVAMHGGGRVLVVEMNARKPSLMWRFGLTGKDGVTDYLTGAKELSTLVQTPASRAFDVLPIGTPDATKVQLHLERGFPRLVDEAMRTYDVVIVDAPPVVLSPETPPMCGLVDGVALIVQSGRTKREIGQRSLEMIAQFEGRVLGVVLNRKKYYIPDFIYRRL